MLVLSRLIGQVVMINDDITVTILKINGSQVKLGITAPKSVAVHRKETYERLQKQGQGQKVRATTTSNATGQLIHDKN